jgi:hypothetical protein
MPEIKITPAELRTLADALESNALRIKQGANETGRTIEGAISGGVFSGIRAENLIGRFRQTQPTMEVWPNQLTQFASMLRDAADAFTQADLVGGGGSVKGASTGPSDDAANQKQIDGLKQDIADNWKKVKDDIADLVRETGGLAIEQIILLLIPEAASKAAFLANLARFGVTNSGKAAELFDSYNKLLQERKSFVELEAVQMEKTMNPAFNNPAELNKLRNQWSTLQQDGINSRASRIDEYVNGSPNDIVQRLAYASSPVIRLSGMAASYDSYFDSWISNENNIDTASAGLQAVQIRAGKI